MFVPLTHGSRVHDQCGVAYRALHALFGARDIRKAFGKRNGAVIVPCYNRCHGVRPLFNRRKNGGGGTARAEHDDTCSDRFPAEECSSGGIEASYVGVVAVKLLRVEPESVHRTDLGRQIGQVIAEIVNGDLVRNGHVPCGIGTF